MDLALNNLQRLICNKTQQNGVRRWCKSVRDGVLVWLQRRYVDKPLLGLPLPSCLRRTVMKL